MDAMQRAERELADIERKLVDLVPLQQRRDQLRTFISIGRNLFGDATERVGLTDTVTAVVTKAGTTAKAKILDAAEAVIAAEGPMQTRTLLERVEAKGIEIGGADKLVTISVVMSRAKNRFKSDRAAGGWTLISRPHQEEPPPGAPTPAGS